MIIFIKDRKRSGSKSRERVKISRRRYLDLYLIHWPVPGKHVRAYKTLEKLVDEGTIRSIGFSNYTIEDYEELKREGIRVKPVVNQIEVNPFLHRKRTIAYFQKHEGIVIQAYRGLRQGKTIESSSSHGALREVREITSTNYGSFRGAVRRGVHYKIDQSISND